MKLRSLMIAVLLALPLSLCAQLHIVQFRSGAANPQAAQPTFSPPAPGPYSSAQSVTCSTSTTACNTSTYLYFDQTNPPTTQRNTATISSSGTWYCYVHNCPSYSDSLVASGAYTISGGGSTWSVAQFKYYDVNGNGTGGSSCATGTSACTVNTTAIGAGHPVVVFLLTFDATQRTLSSATGESWAACPNCSSGTSSSGWLDMRYVLSATGGETSVTCNASGTAAGYIGCGVIELTYSGSSASYDTSNIITNSGCTSCAAPSLTLTGSNDAIIEIGMTENSLTAITSPWSTNGYFYGGTGEAIAVNQTSYAAPTWTQDSSGWMGGSALALKGN